MNDTITLQAVRRKLRLLEPLMTERLRRQWAACEADSLGRGGVGLVARATGLSRTTSGPAEGNCRGAPSGPGRI